MALFVRHLHLGTRLSAGHIPRCGGSALTVTSESEARRVHVPTGTAGELVELRVTTFRGPMATPTRPRALLSGQSKLYEGSG